MDNPKSGGGIIPLFYYLKIMITVDYLRDIVQEAIADQDIFIVSIDINAGNKIDIALDSMGYINIEQCAEINKFLRNKLGEEGDIYEITVGSAGMDKPFKTIQQYQKNINREVKVLSKDGKVYKGVLKSVNEVQLELLVEKTKKNKPNKIFETELVTLEFDEIKQTQRIIKF